MNETKQTNQPTAICPPHDYVVQEPSLLKGDPLYIGAPWGTVLTALHCRKCGDVQVKKKNISW